MALQYNGNKALISSDHTGLDRKVAFNIDLKVGRILMAALGDSDTANISTHTADCRLHLSYCKYWRMPTYGFAEEKSIRRKYLKGSWIWKCLWRFSIQGITSYSSRGILRLWYHQNHVEGFYKTDHWFSRPPQGLIL